MSDRPAIGLVGCGSWGRYILRGLRSLGCPVHVVARPEPSRGNAAEFGAATIVESVDRLPPVAVWSFGGEAERRPISSELPLLRELRAFVEHLEGGPPPRSSAAGGATIVQRVEQLRGLAGSTL